MTTEPESRPTPGSSGEAQRPPEAPEPKARGAAEADAPALPEPPSEETGVPSAENVFAPDTEDAAAPAEQPPETPEASGPQEALSPAEPPSSTPTVEKPQASAQDSAPSPQEPIAAEPIAAEPVPSTQPEPLIAERVPSALAPKTYDQIRPRRSWPRIVALMMLLGAFTILATAVLFRFVNPPFTTVMVAEKIKGWTLRRQWVPLNRISPNLRLAVIASEDGRFCEHWGVDWGAVRDAVEESRKGGFRGASTITMQTAKNVYLWTERSYVRKLMEVPLAYLLSVLWPKERVMEVYLNVAQWGPGIFGAEAASRRYFGKSASALNRREALLLAVSLPSPRLRNPARPSARMMRLAKSVERRMPGIAARAACVRPQAAAKSRTGSGQGRRQPL